MPHLWTNLFLWPEYGETRRRYYQLITRRISPRIISFPSFVFWINSYQTRERSSIFGKFDLIKHWTLVVYLSSISLNFIAVSQNCFRECKVESKTSLNFCKIHVECISSNIIVIHGYLRVHGKFRNTETRLPWHERSGPLTSSIVLTETRKLDEATLIIAFNKPISLITVHGKM